ncbi:DUF5343 domain-containing protein [uncultured Ruegeria sp.]|uniref:DUF5343 domain-containing protein n=1 Tax=uncultured Ruegeria sp. TaxID=259304 RepID=UPI00263682D8|nr:DUF5343 domain-containing protein [uncultured Ruegeria sp.]
MASLPYVTSSGNIEKALAGIKAAAVPEFVSQDFVKTILKIPGGSGNQMTTFLKKLGLAAGDGKPTDLYISFRNPATSGKAIANAIRKAYAPLYIRSEYMHELDDDSLRGLIIEETGQAHDANSVRYTFSCISALKKFAKLARWISKTLQIKKTRSRITVSSQFMSSLIPPILLKLVVLA